MQRKFSSFLVEGERTPGTSKLLTEPTMDKDEHNDPGPGYPEYPGDTRHMTPEYVREIIKAAEDEHANPDWAGKLDDFFKTLFVVVAFIAIVLFAACSDVMGW